jgi:serine O-acetyltransferase
MMFDNLKEDWRTYEGDIWRQGLWVMWVYRFGRWRYRIRPAWLRKPFSLLYKLLRTASQMTTGIELPCETQIGRRLRIEHFGGIIISGDAVIGDDVVLRHGVTLGLRRTNQRGAPRIGHRVDIGAGAKILGSVVIGDDAIIGANAVVLQDVPAGALAVGIPARIIRRDAGPEAAVTMQDESAPGSGFRPQLARPAPCGSRSRTPAQSANRSPA